MTGSSLISQVIPAAVENYYNGRSGAAVNRIIIHHMAARWTAKRCAESFQDPSRGASATYCIGYDGEIVQCVDENNAPGTSGSYSADQTAITVECSNDSTGGDWPVSGETLDSLIRLCADIAKRYGFKELKKGENLCWHSMYAATACPGPYLISQMDRIASEANGINSPAAVESVATGYSCTIAGKDAPRTKNALILYQKGASTGTSPYGYEVALDRNKVVLSDPVYGKGNMAIPTGGYVLSGHGSAGEWLYGHVKAGYLMWFDGSAHSTVGVYRTVDAVNSIRRADFLAVYNGKGTADTNPYGYEVSVGADGKAVENPVYGKGQMPVPSGGFVLSGHGKAGEWIHKNVKKGSTVIFNGKTVQIK